MRALLLYRATPEYQPIYVTDTAEELAELAKLYTGERILAAQEIIHQAMNELRFTARGRVTAEMCLYDLCREDNRTLKTLAARVSQLERELEALKAGGLTVAVSQEPAVIAAPAETRKEKPAEVAKVKPAEVINTKPAETTKAKSTEASKVKAAEPVEKPVQQKPKEEAPVVPVKTPQPQPVATEAKKEKAKTTVTEETKVAASPAGNNPSAIPPVVPGNTDVPGAGNGSSDQGYTPYAGDWATGDEYWTRTMEILKAERKQSIAACASHGYVMAYENQTLIVGFKMKYLCERLQKPDYREVVEDVLLRVARVPVRLQCVEDTGGKPVAKGSARKSSAAASGKSNTPANGEAQPNVSESTKKAMEMFNATLHQV
jgi:DNA polymerase-3 subunit gamma/tau